MHTTPTWQEYSLLGSFGESGSSFLFLFLPFSLPSLGCSGYRGFFWRGCRLLVAYGAYCRSQSQSLRASMILPDPTVPSAVLILLGSPQLFLKLLIHCTSAHPAHLLLHPPRRSHALAGPHGSPAPAFNNLIYHSAHRIALL